MANQRGDRGAWLDRAAVTLSGLCLAHCLATAAFVAVLASAGGLLVHPLVHEIGLLLAILLAATALGRGWRRHRAVLPAAIGAAGLSVMAAALATSHGVMETALTMTGVGIVAMGHVLNRRAHG